MNHNIKRLSKLISKLKISGFTLTEILIVLGMTSLLMIIMIKPVQNMYENYQERLFWNNLKYTWNREFTVLSHRQQRGVIKFEAHRIIFEEGSKRVEVIKIPASLLVYSFKQVMINKTGQTTGQKVRINSVDNKRHYLIVIQVGWGKYYVQQVE